MKSMQKKTVASRGGFFPGNKEHQSTFHVDRREFALYGVLSDVYKQTFFSCPGHQTIMWPCHSLSQ